MVLQKYGAQFQVCNETRLRIDYLDVYQPGIDIFDCNTIYTFYTNGRLQTKAEIM
jgi:hypothetical protein